jgi:oligopeptide transport system permease protein
MTAPAAPAPARPRTAVATVGPESSVALLVRRFRRDRIAVAALLCLLAIVLACFAGEPLLERMLGHGPNEPFPAAVDFSQRPVGPWTHVARISADGHAGKALLPLGGDGTLGRDELLRLLAGGRVSLEIGLFGTVIALVIGVFLGTVGGYYGGAVDGVINRLTELFMSFPLLLLVIAIGQTIADRFADVTLGVFEPGVLALAVVIGLFAWFYPARVSRALVQSLRQQEFIEAAHMVGGRNGTIIRKHILPHLYGPLIVWGTLVAAGVIVLEASLSVLNFGVRFGTASWGSMLAQSWGTLLNFNPGVINGIRHPIPALLKLWPSLALFLTVLCLALIGDGLRSALDSRGER